MRLWRLVLCWWMMWGGVLAGTGVAQEIVLKAWTIGPDDPSIYRATNLHTAAERLNEVNAQHALHSGHLAIRTAEVDLPAYAANRFLLQATGLLHYAHFAPNHADWSQYEAIVTEAMRAVQTRRLAPPEAVQFVTMRIRQQLHQQVRIVD